MSLHPSRLAVQAAGRPHAGLLSAKEPGLCAMCGQRHDIGDPVTPFAPTDSFTDFPALRAKSSRLICGWCAATCNDLFTQKALKTVICREGVFPAASNAHIAYWLLNPPEGPWLWIQGDQKKQHIIWRTPVNNSRDVYQVRHGEQVLSIRRERLLPACDTARRLAKAASEGRKGAALKSPFVRLSRDLDDPAHGCIRPDLHARALTDKAVQDDIRHLQRLSPGELWALTALLYAQPERPQPYFTPSSI